MFFSTGSGRPAVPQGRNLDGDQQGRRAVVDSHEQPRPDRLHPRPLRTKGALTIQWTLLCVETNQRQ